MSGNEKDKELDISNLDFNGIFSPRIVSHRQFRSGPSNEYSLSKRLVGNQHRKMKKAKHRSQTGFTSPLRARNMASPRFKQASSKNIQNVEFRCNVRKLALGKRSSLVETYVKERVWIEYKNFTIVISQNRKMECHRHQNQYQQRSYLENITFSQDKDIASTKNICHQQQMICL